MDSSLLIAASIFIFVVLAALVLFHYLNLHKKKSEISERIRQKSLPEDDPDVTDIPGWQALFQNVAERFGRILKPQNEEDVSKTRLRLIRAGFSGEKVVMTFLGSKACGMLLVPALFMIVKVSSYRAMPVRQFWLSIICAVIAGFLLPDYYIYLKAKQRKRKLFEGFPDALDLLVVCVEAGMGLDASIKRVGDEMALKNKLLSEELRTLSLELRAGKPRIDALKNLASRTDLEDVSSLVTLLVQTDRFGTRVAQALRVYSDSMRTKRYQRAEEIASRIPVKILFPLVIFILPATILTLLGPGIIKVYRDIVQGGSW